MSPISRRISLLALALALASRTSSAAPVTASDGAATATVDVDAKAGVVKRRAGAGAEERLPFSIRPGDVIDEKAVTTVVVAIGSGRSIAHVRIGLSNTTDRAYEAIVPATGAPIFLGATGYVSGVEGERTGEVVQLVPRGDGTDVVTIAEVREDRRLCGQTMTLLSPRGLDPATMKLRGATLQRLGADERTKAKPVFAIARRRDATLPLARTLRAEFASGGDFARLTDGDHATAWHEERPSDGRGEFVVMRSPPEVSIERFGVVVSPDAKGTSLAAPRTFYLLAGGATFKITLPEDAAMHPGDLYEIPLADPVRGGCVAVVLDEAYGNAPHPDVAIAEVVAYTEFDRPGAKVEDVVKALRGGGSRAEAAAALLQRMDPPLVLEHLARAYDALDAAGRALAITVATGMPGCADAAPLYVRALSDADREIEKKGRGRLERCGAAAGPALVDAVRGSDARLRSKAAPLLALVAPGIALEPLASILGEGDVAARREARTAFATAARSADAQKIAALLAAAPDANKKIEILRAARARLPDLRAEAEQALVSLAIPGRPMAARYLLLEPIAALADPGTWSHGELVTTLRSAEEWPLRARAAELAAGRPGLATPLAAAADDPEPRVREAAIASLGDEGARAAVPVLLARLEKDPWTFVRVAAGDALARTPPDPAVDARLVRLLDDPSPRVEGEALAILGAHHAVPVPAALDLVADAKRDLDVRRSAISALGAACATGALPELTKRARALAAPMPMEADLALGIAAVDALGRIHPKDLAERLGPLLAKGKKTEIGRMAERAIAEPGACP